MDLSFVRNVKNTFTKTLGRRVNRLACNSLLYGWSLRGSAPQELLFSPRDLWMGSADKGRWLIHSGVFTLGGDRLELHNADWHPEDAEESWIEHIHSFEWLRDLKALGGDQGRMAARAMVRSWIEDHHGWHELYWRPDILGRRVANWAAAFDFFGESAGEDFQEMFFCSLSSHVRALSRALSGMGPGGVTGLPLLHAIKGLAYGGLIFEGREADLERALNLLDREIDRQILSDGGHISRNPQSLLETIKILIDIRGALQQGGYPPLEKIQFALDRAVPALRFFRHGDRRFALFNGCQESDEETLKSVLMHAGSRAKVLNSLPHTGFERAALGKGFLIMDCGKPPSYPHDESVHAAPLSFEFSYGRDRIFVNCGSHPTSRDWQDALRAAPAHNALVIDDRNICEVHQDGSLVRKPRKVLVTREDKKDEILIDACHDGYVPLNGITHRRRLMFSGQGHDLRGEENLSCAVGLGRLHQVAIRFHLHPRVSVSLVQEGTEALLRLKGGMGWRFSVEGAVLLVENSIYLGRGIRPAKTKQLVLRTSMDTDFSRIKWALQKESA